MKSFSFPIYLLFLLIKTIFLYKKPTNAFFFMNNDFHLSNPEDITGADYYHIFYYYQLPVQETKSNTVIQFKLGQGYSTKIAIYAKMKDIKQNERGEFIDARLEYELSVKEIVIAAEEFESFKDLELYMVIYDLKYAYADTLRIFSEERRIYIESNNCYYLHRLYAHRSMTFYAINTNNYRYISLNMAYSKQNSPILEIRENSASGRLIKEYRDLKRHELIDIASTKNYYFIFKAKDGIETDEVYDVNFCFEFRQRRITDITNESSLQRSFTFDRPFYFKLDLRRYNKDEESSVVLDYAYTANDPFDGFYCKYVDDSLKEDELMPQFPTREEHNECAVEKDDLIDTTYHLYFKHSHKDLNALLVYVKVKGAHPTPSTFQLLFLNRIPQIEDNYFERDLKIDVPQYYKIDLNAIESNVIVASSGEFAMAIVLNSLSTGKVPTKSASRSQLYAINKIDNAQAKESVVYVKLYGGKENINFEIYFVPQKIIYNGREQRSQSVSIAMNDCTDYIYYIGSFIRRSFNFLSVDQPYGKGNIYYQQAYDSNNRIQDNLLAEQSKDLVGSTKTRSNVDILKITCTVPRHVIINYLPQNKPPDQLQIGDSFKTIMTNNQELAYDITPTDHTGLEAKIDTIDSQVAVYIDGKIITELNQSNMVYKQTLNKNQIYSIAFKSLSSTESLFSLNLGSLGLYPTTITQTTATKDQHILIELDKSKQFYTVDISISSLDEKMSLCLLEGFYDKHYIPIPKHNCHSFTEKHTLKVINPYDKYALSISPYYIAIIFAKAHANDVSIVINYEEKEQATPVNESKVVLTDTDALRLRTIKQNDQTKTLLYYSFVPCIGHNMDYQILFNKEIVFQANNVSSKSSNATRNLFADIDFQFSPGKGVFSYNYVTQKQYDDFELLYSDKINISINHNEITMKFAPLIKGKRVTYDIYAVMAVDKTPVIDECSLYDLKPIDTLTVSETEDIIEHQITVRESGNYQLNIVATTAEGITARKAYQATGATIQYDKDPDPDPNSSNYIWLWILIGCISAIGVIGVIVLIVRLVKYLKAKEESNQEMIEPFDQAIE